MKYSKLRQLLLPYSQEIKASRTFWDYNVWTMGHFTIDWEQSYYTVHVE